MASRDFLKIMKLARSGDALAQQKMGEIYLLGSDGIPKNSQNALLWLEKSSLSIGFIEDISILLADHLDLSSSLSPEHAPFAWKCLLHASNAGHSRARWLVAQVVAHFSLSKQRISSDPITAMAFAQMTDKHWADAGGMDSFKVHAQRYLEELADLSSFKEQSAAQILLSQCLQDGRLGVLDIDRSKKIMIGLAIQANTIGLSSLSSFANSIDKDLVPALKVHLPQLLLVKKPLVEHTLLYWAAWQHIGNVDALEIAAELAYTPAQLALGLRLAKLNLKEVASTVSTTTDGNSAVDNSVAGNDLPESSEGNARLKRAVYWLKQAANKGERDALYALGLINRMPQYSGYSAEDSDQYFDKAADLGHPDAQYRKGAALWRKRGQSEEDIEGMQASYWIWHAAQQGVVAAKELLSKVMISCPHANENRWSAIAQACNKALSESTHRLTGDTLLTCHRVIVANQLNLSKAELLLTDIASVQHEHGAVIDIREHLPRSVPKLILIETLEQRKALMMASKAFANVFSNHIIDEGNLRQRRYRLEKLMQILEVSIEDNLNDFSDLDDLGDDAEDLKT
jgi:TPR repeat protein